MDDLNHCVRQLRHLTMEIRRLETSTDPEPGDRLLLLEIRQALTALIAHMRRQQLGILQKQASATRASRASHAYARLAHRNHH